MSATARSGPSPPPIAGPTYGAGADSFVPRFFQLLVAIFILGTGTFPQALQAATNGVAGDGGGFAMALLAGLVYDLLRIAPLIVLARHPNGILHPIIVAIVIWPLIVQLPTLMSEAGGYSGLLSGQILRPPFFLALSFQSAEQGWLHLAWYNALQILALLSLYGGFAIVSRKAGTTIPQFAAPDTLRLRNVLIGIIIVNFIAVAAFIQLRGGLIEHIAELAFGRFRALEGLGPLLALFDIGSLAMLVWIAYRPRDASKLIFVSLLALVIAQQFIVAGSRSAAYIALLLIGLGWALGTRRLPWRLGLLLLPIALLSFGALNLIRTAGLSGTTAVEAAQEAELESIIERSQTEFDQRQAVSGSVPVVADGVRTTGLQWGFTYSGAVFAMVPRAIWPEKPRGPGSIYAQTFLGQERQGTAVPISGVAEAYWNFHIPGIVLLFALHGALLRRVHIFYEANRQNGFVCGFFVLFATQFGISTEQLVAFQQSILTYGIIIAIAVVFYPSAWRSPRSRTSVT